jgi:hypothetical protein
MKKRLKTFHLIILFMAAHTVFTIMTFFSPNITNGGLDIFDLRMFVGYDLTYANRLIESLSTSGLNYYQYVLLPLDYLYPLLLSIFFFLFFKKVTGSWLIGLLGFLSMLFDFVENTLILVMLRSNSLNEQLVNTASTFTILKGYSYLINYLLFIVLFIVFVLRKSNDVKVN